MLADKPNYCFERVQPTRNVIGVDNLSGSTEFIYHSAPDRRIDWNNVYASIHMTLTAPSASFRFGLDSSVAQGAQANTDFSISATQILAGVVTQPDLPARQQYYNPFVSNTGVVQNPFGAIFKSAHISINDKKVSNSDVFGIAQTQLKYCFEDKDEMKQGSPITPVEYSSINYLDATSARSKTSNATIVSREGKLYMLNDQLYKTYLRTSMVSADVDKALSATISAAGLFGNGAETLNITLTSKLDPLLMITGATDLPTCRLNIVFNMDGDVKTRLPLLCGLTKSGVDGTASTPASIPLTSYDVKDFSLWIPTYVSTIPVSLNLTLPYVETQTYTYQYSASVQIQSPTPSVSTLLLSFKKDASEVSYVDNHQFDGVFGTASIQLKSLQVIFAGNSYPKAAPYDFTPFTGDLDYCKDMENAYMAYRTFSLSKEAASTSMTFTQWLMAPVFVFSLLPISPSQDRTIQINTSTTGNTALCKMHVTFLYPRELKLSYDENAMLLPVEVSDEV